MAKKSVQKVVEVLPVAIPVTKVLTANLSPKAKADGSQPKNGGRYLAVKTDRNESFSIYLSPQTVAELLANTHTQLSANGNLPAGIYEVNLTYRPA